ncbi:MAG TPA: YdeI/OmpD-associated family protein [Anaerolineales bacterium]|nr:YdeI/OmpD-associated family protein [Anaerolineales bacterium]
MGVFSFEAVLKRPEGVGTWTYLDIPQEISLTLGSKGQVRVRGTINGYPYRTTALPMGAGTHYLVVGKAIRDHIHATQGDSVQVTLELDNEARQVDVPEELRQALAKEPHAVEAFGKMTYSHQNEWISWIMSAKQAETRLRRIEKALLLITQGKNVRNLSPRKDREG